MQINVRQGDTIKKILLVLEKKSGYRNIQQWEAIGEMEIFYLEHVDGDLLMYFSELS